MQRRDFLKLSGLMAAGGIASQIPGSVYAAGVTGTDVVEKEGFSILQGLTTETTTQLTIDVPEKNRYTYELIDLATGTAFKPTRLQESRQGKSKWRVDKLLFTDLQLGHQYYFSVFDSKGKLLDQRTLKTLDLQNPTPKIAVMSCMWDIFSSRKEMWKSVQNTNADILFFIGDAVYGDMGVGLIHGPDYLWSRFIDSRRKLPYYHWRELKPVIAVWDDHDYGKNNEDGTYKHKKHSLRIFKSFFAQDPIPNILVEGPGISTCFHAFNQNFLFCDNRYFRKLEHNKMTGFLGEEQINWFHNYLKDSHQPTWVLEGSMFFGGYSSKKQDYQNEAPEELDVVMRLFSKWSSQILLLIRRCTLFRVIQN